MSFMNKKFLNKLNTQYNTLGILQYYDNIIK